MGRLGFTVRAVQVPVLRAEFPGGQRAMERSQVPQQAGPVQAQVWWAADSADVFEDCHMDIPHVCSQTLPESIRGLVQGRGRSVRTLNRHV